MKQPRLTKEEIFNLIVPEAQYYTDKPIELGSWIASGLELDSLDCVELLMAIEDVLQIEIDDNVAVQWRTVQNVVDGLYRALEEQNA